MNMHKGSMNFMNKKIIVITDFDSVGSGYRSICVPLFIELSKLGYEIKVAGLMYRGEEHDYPFSIIPAQTVQEAMAISTNLIRLWNPEIILVAMDIPVQINLYNQLAQFKKKYIAITPLENGPLTMSWAIPMFNMDAVFFISELGKQEALKVGLKAEHLQIGIDAVLWHPATPEEKTKLRDGLGIPQDAFVILTVADNQERKNLWAGLEAVSRLKKEIDKPIRYILVTREQNPYGYKLRDLVKNLNLKNEYICFERGIPQKDLWGLYAISDVYLQPSKAEGLGLPVMDAMACGIPVVATDTGAMTELLTGRGWLIPAEYEFRDVWGNEKRSMISIEHTKEALQSLSLLEVNSLSQYIPLEYIRQRTWDIPAKQVDDKIKELLDVS